MGVARFWRENRYRYNLIGNRCPICERAYFPPRDLCPVCHRESIGKMEETAFSGRGSLFSYSVVHDAPEDFSDQRPYVMGIVELEEGPRITAQIVELEGDPEIGMPLEMVFRRIREEGPEGVIQYGYKFRPARSGVEELADSDR